GGFSLFLSSKHIIPADAPLHFVRPPIPESTTLEMFRHFGFPLSLIALASIMLIRHKMSALIAAFVLGTTFLHSDAGVFLYLLLSLTLIRQILEHMLEENSPVSDLTLAFEALGLVSIVLLIFPEILFVDDAYGGENERMNTIFKVYTLNWLLLHMFSFYLTARVFGKIKMPQEAFSVNKIFQIAILVLFLAFFEHTIPLRDPLRESDAQVVQPKSRGLSSIEKEFPGSAKTIQALEQLPEGIVLEGQGNPYSYTSHVSTLASKTSYLGWANHVQLLNRAYAEIERREKLTEEFYMSSDCKRRRQILETESIKYAVVGPLEKQRYKIDATANFECLNNLISEGEYKVYSASYPSP
ncbi:MAG: hypothetical protein GYA55_05730, partial [SAR324 cluster bacterium]|nr:hypothetical protein [SAR324 cluster bacterium]